MKSSQNCVFLLPLPSLEWSGWILMTTYTKVIHTFLFYPAFLSLFVTLRFCIYIFFILILFKIYLIIFPYILFLLWDFTVFFPSVLNTTIYLETNVGYTLNHLNKYNDKYFLSVARLLYTKY